LLIGKKNGTSYLAIHLGYPALFPARLEIAEEVGGNLSHVDFNVAVPSVCFLVEQ
jgi:hypothetical protein